MADDQGTLVYDTILADLAAIRIRDGIEAVLTRELGLLGLDAAFEDSFAALVLRVSSTLQTGTAYIELRQDDARMRIVLHPYTPSPLRDCGNDA
jgi:hypothetical protein